MTRRNNPYDVGRFFGDGFVSEDPDRSSTNLPQPRSHAAQFRPVQPTFSYIIPTSEHLLEADFLNQWITRNWRSGQNRYHGNFHIFQHSDPSFSGIGLVFFCGQFPRLLSPQQFSWVLMTALRLSTNPVLWISPIERGKSCFYFSVNPNIVSSETIHKLDKRITFSFTQDGSLCMHLFASQNNEHFLGDTPLPRQALVIENPTLATSTMDEKFPLFSELYSQAWGEEIPNIYFPRPR